jgi:hypothetical protein
LLWFSSCSRFMQAGDTFVITFDHSGPKPHLWILLTEPKQGEPVILVSVTTLRHEKDQTVVLQPGDHPWINHASVVHFGDALVTEGDRLQGWVDGNLAAPNVPCSKPLLKLIRDGIRSSEFTPKKVLRLLDSLKN